MENLKIAILGGTGKEGKGLGYRWAVAGHQVIIGSRQKEKAEVISLIVQQIKDFSISAEELGLASKPRRERKPSAAKAKAKDAPIAKYRGPNGELWSGGRGRKPQWVVDALAAGRKLEEFLV